MSSYITDNFYTLSNRYYIRKARARDYWFDFNQDRLGEYRTQFLDDFCLVLYASDTADDAYILPYSHVKHLFRDEYLDKRRRWVGSISANVLRVRHSKQAMSISAYYNAFEYLEEERNDEPTLLKGHSYRFGDWARPNKASKRPLTQASLRCKRWLKPSSLHRIPTPLKRC